MSQVASSPRSSRQPRASEEKSVETDDDAVIRRIVLHVYDDESRQFSSLTTYHGIKRIYTSTTWTSRLFWALVVVTCLTLFMFHTGIMMYTYVERVTCFKLEHVERPEPPSVTICRSDNVALRPATIRYNLTRRDVDLVRRSLLPEAAALHEQDEATMRKLVDLPLIHLLYAASRPCEQWIQWVLVGDRLISAVSACRHAQLQTTRRGVCLRFMGLQSGISDNGELLPMHIALRLRNDETASVEVHSADVLADMDSRAVVVSSGKLISMQLALVERRYIEMPGYSECRSTWPHGTRSGEKYNMENCRRKCLHTYWNERCNCIPFFLAETNCTLCVFGQFEMCKRQEYDMSSIQCDCPVECVGQSVQVDHVSYTHLHDPTSAQVLLNWREPYMLRETQLKRMSAMDLLSYVAGSMGLFLGMSCVTLLEIFIYLFKFVWGALNQDDDELRQNAAKKTTGLMDDGFPDDQSHEQIVIEQRLRRSEAQNLGAESVENIAIRVPRRKNAIFSIMPPQQSQDEAKVEERPTSQQLLTVPRQPAPIAADAAAVERDPPNDVELARPRSATGSSLQDLEDSAAQRRQSDGHRLRAGSWSAERRFRVQIKPGADPPTQAPTASGAPPEGNSRASSRRQSTLQGF